MFIKNNNIEGNVGGYIGKGRPNYSMIHDSNYKGQIIKIQGPKNNN